MIHDIEHIFGIDIAQDSIGDLMTAAGEDRGKQRILRRLITNPGEYIWHPEYGAGLPSWIGRLEDDRQIAALIKGQMLLEDCVAKIPEPVVTVKQIFGGISCSIQYVHTESNTPQTLSFNVKV